MENIDKYVSKLIDILIAFGPKLIGALLVLIIGLWVAKIVTKSVYKIMEKRNVDPSLRPFLRSLLSALFKTLIIISALGLVGIEMTSFIAILGAAGLAVGLALSGTLQNLAGGVMILIFKPFKVGDVIEAQGFIGSVYEIQIFSTILKTPDNKVIILPNGGLSNSSMVNYSNQNQRRVDLTFGVAYGTETEKVKAIIFNLLKSDGRVLEDPKAAVVLSQLADSSVNFTVRAWVVSADYWDVLFSINEKVYEAFNKEGINIPFPQIEVHMAK